MRQESKLAKLCVSISIKGWTGFTALVLVRSVFLSIECESRPGKVAIPFLARISGKNGLLIHIVAALTHIIAPIWQSAQRQEQEFDSSLS